MNATEILAYHHVALQPFCVIPIRNQPNVKNCLCLNMDCSKLSAPHTLLRYVPYFSRAVMQKGHMQTIKDHLTSIDIKSDAKLSVKYWNLKAGNSKPKVIWKVKNQFSAYKPLSKRCSLCLNEKLEIFEDKENNLWNNISEVISKCRHQNKNMLRTLASKIQNPNVKKIKDTSTQ